MLTRSLLVLALAAAATAAESPRPRLIDFNPWSWIPTSRNRSPSIMDYFFPPSRTPKNTNLSTSSILPTSPPDSTTTLEERTTATRKSSPTTVVVKSRPTVTMDYATTTQKVKKTQKTTTASLETTYETRTTTVKPYKDPTTTTKHYTIKPVVRTTVEPTSMDTDSTLESESTVSDSETTLTTAAEGGRETEAPGGTAADARATDAAAATTEPATPADATADAPDSREGYLPLRDKPQPQQTHVKINDQTKKETVPLPAGSTNVLAKPTKYHYYPHNQHIYLLPECAIQQVCNAVYVRLNYTQPLCACPNRYRDPCSASLNADDLHTTRLTTDSKKKYASKAVTLVKTCEAVSEMRECRAPRDWSLLALQNIRTGKSHYLVICRCPENHILEGPMSHDQPTYASVPGIRVYGMMCVKPSSFHSGFNGNRFTVSVQSSTSGYKVDYSQPHSYGDKPAYSRFPSQGYQTPNYYNRMSRHFRLRRDLSGYPPFPWYKVREFAQELHWLK